jgi:hypothetical protein
VNKDGFEVDIIRREKKQTTDDHPMRMTAHEDDFWAVQARGAESLLNSKSFLATVVSASGDMAIMKTIDPNTFIKFKRWMAQLPDRDVLKKPRDLVQAQIVEKMIEEYLPQYKVENTHRNKMKM